MLPGVGVFGTSLTARVIIPLLKSEGFSVEALWGRTQEEAEELAKEMDVPFYTSRIDDVLLHQDVDLVCINLPPPLTRQIAVKTLGERGIFTMCMCSAALLPIHTLVLIRIIVRSALLSFLSSRKGVGMKYSFLYKITALHLT